MIDFHYVLTEFPCRLGAGDCGESCNGPYKCCQLRPQAPLLPGEGAFLSDHGFKVGWHKSLEVDVFPCPGREACPGVFRPIVCKSFPLSPGKLGLLVSQVCGEHRWLNWEFVIQVERMWRYIMSNSKDAQAWVAKIGHVVWSKENRIPLWMVQRKFDAEYFGRYGRFNQPGLREHVMELGWIKAGDRVADVGGGNGIGVLKLVKAGVDAFVVDVNPIFESRERWVEGDVEDLPLPDNSVDVALCIDVLEHLPDWEWGLLELLRVSRGRVVVFVGTLEDEAQLKYDATHKVFMPFTLWLERFAEYADIEEVTWGHTGVLLKKKGAQS